jgi:hypothetical protein
MMVKFLEAAENELYEAITFYNVRSNGLGFEFSDEVKSTIQRIEHNPEAWTPLSKRARRCQTNRFPYGIIYQVRGDIILIISVMHLRRNPKAWRERIPKKQQ